MFHPCVPTRVMFPLVLAVMFVLPAAVMPPVPSLREDKLVANV